MSIHVTANFYSIATWQGRMRREEVNRFLAQQTTASFNGKVLVITSRDGTQLHTAQVPLGHRREMGDWCNEFNKRRHVSASYRR